MNKQVNTDIVNLFSVDVEDYFQVSAFERYVQRKDWDKFECRVVPNTHRMLRLLARHNVRGTFFVLGWIAEHYPQLVRDIQHDGHEIASHGYWHRLIYEQTPEQFRADLRQASDVIQNITGTAINAYRAPSFSITKQSLWALEILVEEGYSVDFSIFPIHHDRYGIPDAKPFPHQINATAGSLWELPPSIVRFAGQNLPVSGGGYFRLFPLFLTMRCLKKIGRSTGQPFIFYVHPWEIDPEQPRLFKNASLKSKFRHYINLHKTIQKLDALLPSFRFGTVSEVIRNCSAQQDSSKVMHISHPLPLGEVQGVKT
jgi:polysaccharide deacetylase family protein (PEP-CTERM system associated)